jgi:FlaA1/EpsC-like NDP-sugar epimerase
MKILKRWRTIILLSIDIAAIITAYLSSMYFRFGFEIPPHNIENFKNTIFITVGIYIIFFLTLGLYKSLWIYAGTEEFILAVGGCTLAGLVGIVYKIVINYDGPYSLEILSIILTTLFVCSFRICFRIYRRVLIILPKLDKKNKEKRIMIVGAGSAGALIIKEMKAHKKMNYRPVAIIDDDSSKKGTTISGVRVCGNRYKIKEIAEKKNVDTIIIAIPSVSDKKEIIEICKNTDCKIKTIPGVYELIDEKYILGKIRDVDVEDLLRRETIELDTEGISDYIRNKTVLVTGGGGSIGAELCRQIAKYNPRQLLILDFYENNVYELQYELMSHYPSLSFKIIIASVRDRNRIEKVFAKYNIDLVFHAAAHKHVPLMEDNPEEAVKNNVFGTLNLVESADKYGVKRFVFISTDKAVNPANVMGATKRICEMIIQGMDKISQTEFVAVRFGNVLGSSGSVVPLFKKQIAEGGPVTLTHREVTRYFMTIPEAVQLVLQASAFAEGGEIFILDMGKPVKIYDLACDLIRLSGLEPESDIKIEITGLRPGEKLHEELLTNEEGIKKTNHEKIFIGKPTFSDIEKLKLDLNELRILIESGNCDNDCKSNEELGKKIIEIAVVSKKEA